MKKRAARERANREVLYPASLSPADKLCYRAVDILARAQAFIMHRLVKEPVWRSGSGEVRRMCDLDDRHLENIVRMVERDGSDVAESMVSALLNERARRFQKTEEAQRARRAQKEASQP